MTVIRPYSGGGIWSICLWVVRNGLTPIFNTFQHLFEPGSVSNVAHAVRESIYFRQPGGWQKEYNTEYQRVTINVSRQVV